MMIVSDYDYITCSKENEDWLASSYDLLDSLCNEKPSYSSHWILICINTFAALAIVGLLIKAAFGLRYLYARG